jgi:hypothetical protein
MTPDESEPTPPPERGTVEVELHPQPGVAVVAVRAKLDKLGIETRDLRLLRSLTCYEMTPEIPYG